MKERWKTCERFTGRRVSIWQDAYGYPSVSLQKAGRWLKPAVHLLVYRTFRGRVPKGHEIDHRDRNRANARLSNLRCLTRWQNRAWALRARGSSRYRGVTWHAASGRWQAQISHLGDHMCLGMFDSQRAAALAYDRAARRYHGKYSVLNFRKGKSYMKWTDERVEELKGLRAAKLSYAEIAKLIPRASRNAVAGKLYRLGLGLPAPKRAAKPARKAS